MKTGLHFAVKIAQTSKEIGRYLRLVFLEGKESVDQAAR
jgi:hypothetical protein